MNTKHIKQILVLVCCVTFVMSSTFAVLPYVYADAEQDVVEEIKESVQESQPVKTAAQKKKEKKAKKEAATKKNRDKIVKFAKKQVGKPYKYGAKGPKSFDCIGLVYYVFKHSGAKLRSSVDYKKICRMNKSYGKYIFSHSKSKAKAGDIVLFSKGGKVKHACIAIGNGKCVNATRKGVKVMKIQPHKGQTTSVIRLVK